MRTITEYLLRNRAEDPAAAFLRLVDGAGAGRTLTYREVIDSALGWGRGYAEFGLRPGDRVIVILPHSADLYAAFLGALLGGMVPCMFNFPSPKFSEEEYFRTIGLLIENAAPRLIVAYPELEAKLSAALGERPGGARLCAPESFPETAAGWTAQGPPDPDATAFLQYSSGTTGVKKGVEVSHRALLWQVETYAEALRLRRDDVIASWLPLYHDMGLIACLFLPFLKRVPLVAMSPFDWVRRPALLARAAAEHRATLVWMPNFAFHVMAGVPAKELEGLDLSALRGVINCSEPVMARSMDEFAARYASLGVSPGALCSCYAMAEFTFAASSGGFGEPPARDSVDVRAFARGSAAPADAADPAAKVLVSSGRALPGVEAEIVSDSGETLPERAVGEIVLRGPCLFKGYFRDPEATGKALRDGRYYTGDLGYLADGHLYVTGRKKDLIIVGGQNIYPQDLEALVNAVDGAIPGRNVALGVPDPESGTEKLVLLVETHEADPARRESLRAAIYRAIASRSDVVPREIRLVEHMWLRKSSSGKISRSGNLAKYLEAASATASLAQAPGPGEAFDPLPAVRRCVAAAVRRHAGAGRLHLDDDTALFSSGLVDSLTLAELLSELERATGAVLPPTVRIGEPDCDDIRGLAAALRAGPAAASDRQAEPLGADAPVSMVLEERLRVRAGGSAFWTWYYRLLFRFKGIPCGHGFRAHGPIWLRLKDGKPGNLRIGDDVVLMPFVDLKLRGEGKIILHDGVVLDTGVRLVAANEARLELGDEVQIAMGSIINAGADVLIGRRTAIAGYCVIIASEHGIARGQPIMSQGYRHSPVHIGEDVWLASHVFVGRGSRIGDGAVVAAQASVCGRVPPEAVWAGHPGRVIKYRS